MSETTGLRALDPVRSVKVKLGLLVAASVVLAAVIATIGAAGGVPVALSIPVTVTVALGVTQLLAVGMTSPLREMTAAARRMATGDHAVRVTATSRDEIGELARAFNSMAEELAGVDRQRRELVANVSHELRTPLAALCAVLENLADGVADPDPATLRVALAQGERMSGLVGDLLDLSRVDAGHAPLARETVAVRALLEAAVDEARVGGRAPAGTFAVDVEPRDLAVEGDPARLHQLVANLIDNAARHGPPGGTVTVRARACPGSADTSWRLEVLDEGPGVAPEHRERAFERFGTLRDVATGGGGGTGLGLAIARWVTDLHGGSIGFADPAPGTHGARVVADLPTVPTRPRQEESAVPDPDVPEVPGPATGGTTTLAPPEPTPAEPASLTDALFGEAWPDRGVPGDVRVLLGALGVGVLAGAILPFRDPGLATFLVLLAAGGVLLAASRHRRDPFTLTCAGLCLALSAVVVLRDAEWIVGLCLLAAVGLGMVGLVRGRRVPSFLVAAAAWPLAAVRGVPWLGRTARALTGLGNGAALLRTAVWSAVGVTVFALLFASADALFAEWVDAVVPDVGSEDVAVRVFVAVAVGGLVLCGAYLALNPPRAGRVQRAARPVAHRFEWLAPVLVVDAVFVLFLAAQATAFFGGHEHLERTTGLTYAQYVHQGFGQLTIATLLTLLVVWAASRKAPRTRPADRAWLRGALGVLCAATLVVVASALYRMHLYEQAYGLTRARLLAAVFEGWLGVLVLAVIAGAVALRARWLPRFGLVSGVVLLLALAALNPDAYVARQNLDRYAVTGTVDWGYLRDLSDDAVPALEGLPRPLAECALQLDQREVDDALAWNLGRTRADAYVEAQGGAWRTRTDCPGQTAAR
ncbi:MAG: histidine kinase [Actinomycetospora sp.]|nr:histidine kinase [Actinomycetospora sp.]